MAGPIDRQGTGTLQELQGTAVRSPQMIRRASTQEGFQEPSSTRASRILDGLAGLVDTTSQLAYDQAKIDVERKKINGMGLALSGGKPAEDASKAEFAGYDLVQSQADLQKANESIAQAIQENPMMTDDELNKLRDSGYGEVLENYKNADPDVFKAVSVKAQESQLALNDIRTSAQNTYRRQKGAETLQYNIGSQIDAAKSMADGGKLISSWVAQGRELGLSEFEVKDQIFTQMKSTANAGDPRLLKFVQNTDWGKFAPESAQAKALYDSHIKQAQAAYEAAQQRQNSMVYGVGLADLETAAKSGVPREQLMQKMQALQKAGLKFSPSSVASYLTMGTNVSESKQKLASNISLWQQGRGEFNLATNPSIAADDKTKVMDAAEDMIVTQANGVPEDERGSYIISNMLRLSKQEGMPIKTIGTALGSLANIDPQAPMTPSVQTWTKYLISADDQTIRMNVPSEKDQKFLFGMRDVLINNQNQDGSQMLPTAIANGQRIRDNTVPVTAQQKKVITNEVRRGVDTLKDPTESTWYFRSRDLPDQTSDYVNNLLNQKATNFYALTQDTKKASEMAVRDFKQNNMILTGGVLANVGAKQLAANVPSLVKPGDDDTMLQRRAVSALDYQINDVIAKRSKADGLDYKREDTQVNFSNGGQSYQVIVGGLVVGTYPTTGLQGLYNEDFFKTWNKEQDAQQETTRDWRTTKKALTNLESLEDANPQLGVTR